jgi:hypothetical protein
MVQLSATRCSCVAILCVSLVSFAAITLCVDSQRVFIVVCFVMTRSGNFWIHPCMIAFGFLIMCASDRGVQFRGPVLHFLTSCFLLR